jgi:hypothetical protein
MATPKAHARFAASSAERWVNCPSSIHLAEKAPEQKSGAAANEGTIAHDLMEKCLVNGLDVGAYANEYGDDLAPVYPLDMRQHVQGFVDFVRSQKQPHHDLIVEEKVYLDFLHPTDAFGTVDVAIVEPFGALHIIDFKYGRGFVKHKDNLQMLYYALGIAHAHHYDFDEIKTTIYQPRAGSGRPDRTDAFSVEKLKSIKVVFEDAIERVEQGTDTSDLSAGDWCKFCPAKVICPAITKTALQKAKLDFGGDILPNPKSLTSDQVRVLLDKANYLELWIKEVKAFAENELKAGKKISGWTLAPTKAQRVWANPNAKSLGVEWLWEKQLITPAQAEKKMKALKCSKEEIEKFMKDNVAFVSGGVKLSQTTNDYDDQWPDDTDVD